jgi:dsDNA-specific endonuclease/ATPase MutS2
MKKLTAKILSILTLLTFTATAINVVIPTEAQAGLFSEVRKQKRQARKADKKAMKARKQAHNAAEDYLKANDKKKAKALKKLNKAAAKAGWSAISDSDAQARAQAIVDHYAKCSGKTCYEDATIPMPVVVEEVKVERSGTTR